MMLESYNPRNTTLVPKILAVVSDSMSFITVTLWLLYGLEQVL